MHQNNIMIIGDVFFSNEEDKLNLFNRIKNYLNNYLVIANLEGSIKFSSSYSKKKAVHLSLSKFKQNEIPDNLIFSLVNNHVTDFGIHNFKINLEYLGAKGIISTKNNIANYIGSQKFIFLADKKEQCLIKGTDFLNFSNKVVTAISNDIKSSIVIVHGGIEFRYYPTPYQRALARRIIDLGAKKVIFHHSHVIGHQEYWNGCLIHYGLGNAFFSETNGIHSLDKSISHAVICNEKQNIIKLNKLEPVDDNRINKVSKININNMQHLQYAKFYKKKYKIDSSFRPRQLSMGDIRTNIQHTLWSYIANFLVSINMSKKIKIILNFFLDNKIRL